MGASLRNYRSRLYRKSRCTVILTVICSAVLGLASAQIARRPPADKGPRALGLLELAANGKAHLVAVTIMLDGRFYDAGAYKADPVPMALHSETVYEAVKSGVSQGLFIVSGAMHDHDKGAWIADGKWRSTAEIEAEKARAKAEAEKRAPKAPPPEQQIGGPPKLKRSPDTQSSSPAATNAPAAQPSAPAQKPASTDSAKSSRSSSSIEDPNRPVLRRGVSSETTHQQTKESSESAPLVGPIQLIPAISDADGPEPRPYTYQMQPEEEQGYRKKMLAMAAEEVRGRAWHGSPEATGAAKSRSKAAPPPAPQFQDVQLHVFDLSNSNEPVLVLTANAHLSSASADLTYIVALVAREDIYGDLHRVFAQTTDNQHLDVLPKYELVDAVDADGDGRGELLFRISSEGGSAFGVYRVIGDKLWPLFEGKPGA
jgi:hypothetical protein